MEGIAVAALSALALGGGLLLGQLDTPGAAAPASNGTKGSPRTATLALIVLTPGQESTPSRPQPPTLTPAPTRPPTDTPTSSPTVTPSPTPTRQCVHPAGWAPYVVGQGDTLSTLSAARGTTTKALVDANCLSSSTLSPGTTIYLPPAPTRTPTRVPTAVCGPPPGWVVYTIVRGDTLYSLARRTGTTVAAVRTANCLSSNAIYVGQALYLPAPPPTPTSVPSPTPTETPVPSPTPTSSATPTELPAPTVTATAAPSLTPSATISLTLTSAP